MQTKLTPAFRKAAATVQPGARTLPQRYFVSPEIFAAEQREIFSKHWVLVGHQSQIPHTGDYFVARIAERKSDRDARPEIDRFVVFTMFVAIVERG